MYNYERRRKVEMEKQLFTNEQYGKLSGDIEKTSDDFKRSTCFNSFDMQEYNFLESKRSINSIGAYCDIKKNEIYVNFGSTSSIRINRKEDIDEAIRDLQKAVCSASSVINCLQKAKKILS
jgi:hypothetical protein